MFDVHWTRAITSAFAAAMLLGGCKGDDNGPGDGQTPRPGDSTKAATTPAAGAQYSVVFRLTGQLLIVPPKGGSGDTRVLLPLKPASIHHVRLGFGIPKPPATPAYAATLCDTSRVFGAPAIRAGICYVDLRRWAVSKIGTGGTTETVADLESRHIVNVTSASQGNEVDFNTFPLDSMIVFGGGAPGQSCSLGKWHFPPLGGSSAVELANVLPWEIKMDQGTPFQLTFTRAGEAPIPVQPLSDASGTVNIVLANLLADELKHLPPGSSPTNPKDPTDPEVKEHFDAYYNLLNHPAPVPTDIARRPRPVFEPGPPPLGCSMRVGALVIPPDKDRGAGTYACLPVAALGNP